MLADAIEDECYNDTCIAINKVISYGHYSRVASNKDMVFKQVAKWIIQLQMLNAKLLEVTLKWQGSVLYTYTVYLHVHICKTTL